MANSLTPISIIIPVHNRADLAAQCLAALGRWTTPLEIIVVDDGSTDPGVELLRGSGGAGIVRHWLHNPEARGFSAAVNRGLEQATGDLLLLLNSDAEVTESGDLAIRAALETGGIGASGASGGSGAVAARLIYPNGGAQWSGGRFPTHAWLFALASGIGRGARSHLRRSPAAVSGFAGGAVDWAPGAALAISRAAFAAVGSFDESYRHYAQDLDYCQRLRSAGRSVEVLADWIVVHHLGASVSGPASSGYDGQRLDLLWLDLLHWARKHRTAAWARTARRALLLGGRLRLLRLRSRVDSSEAVAVAAALAAVRHAGPGRAR